MKILEILEVLAFTERAVGKSYRLMKDNKVGRYGATAFVAHDSGHEIRKWLSPRVN